MNKTIILYQSKYGATEKYARWLAEALSCDCLKTKDVSLETLHSYDTIIIGGGIYASGIAGIRLLKKNYEQLKNKRIIFFAVGASPYDEKALAAIKAHNLTGELADLPLFYCRGAWRESAMSWADRTLCNLLKKSVSTKDPADYAPWESALMEAIGTDVDWTDPNQLQPLIEYVTAQDNHAN